MINRWLAILTFTTATALVGCGSNEIDNQNGDSDRNNTQNSNDAVSIDASQTSPEPSTSSATTQTARAIDWSKIKTDQPAIDPAAYDYPFAIDSQNVKNYADYHNIDNNAAQHSMTVSMASNEALSKVLDELGNSYVSHELIDGGNIKLIVHTTDDIKAASFDYVLADDFAQGLVLPIEIKPDGVKGDAAIQNPHEQTL